MNSSDTIIAPASAVAEAGIAVIRISGKNALSCMERFFSSTAGVNNFASHQLYHGHFHDDEGRNIDEVMAVFMHAPATYTRENVVEIHCHGNRQVVKSILDSCQRSGIRLAEPGEFTYRAFVNGRIDLSQAEAVSRLISANSDSSRRLALSHMEGQLSTLVKSFSDRIRHALVLTEAWIDFPEEDLPSEDIDQLQDIAAVTHHRINDILRTYDYGRIQIEGVSILLVGEPNAGKSSLLNSLLGQDRAIVTAIPGTTRDIIEEGLYIDGLPVKLVDTAGLRETDDPVEVEGIRRAEGKLDSADLVLLLVDGTNSHFAFSDSIIEKCHQYNTWLVVTRSDLSSAMFNLSESPFPVYSVSNKTGEGVDDLKQALSRHFDSKEHSSSESVMLTERRHYDALYSAADGLKRFQSLMEAGETLDILAFELREVLYALGQVSGETTTEDILGDIFSGFCIGK